MELFSINDDGDSFPQVNKKKENDNVVNFQKTGDETILEELYSDRIPTLQVWARKYYYLKDSAEDMFQELTQVFIRSVHGYKEKRKFQYGRKTIWKRTPFNTYLWYSLGNYIKNLRSGKKAKKRRPIGHDGGNFMLSVDSPYKNGDSETSLKDVLTNDAHEVNERVLEDIYLKETLDLLSKKDDTVRKILKKISDGNNVTSLIKECRTKHGTIKISQSMAKKLNIKRRCNGIVRTLIQNENKFSVKFSVLSYFIEYPNYLHYSVELAKSKEADCVMKIIRNLRKDQDSFKEHMVC